jgi:hypothetical protein
MVLADGVLGENRNMPSREELHKLVDSLPEGAIEAAHRTLAHLQTWPPAPPPGAEEMRRRMHERMEERRRDVMQRQRPGMKPDLVQAATTTLIAGQPLRASVIGMTILS